MFGIFTSLMGGTRTARLIPSLSPIVDDINSFEEEIQKLSDDALKGKTEEFRSQLKEGKTLDDILPESNLEGKNTTAATNQRRVEVYYDSERKEFRAPLPRQLPGWFDG